MMTVDVVNCARCGKDHDRLQFNELKRPMIVEFELDGMKKAERYAYWGSCPITSEPIMLQVIQTA